MGIERFRGRLLNNLVQAVETGTLETILQVIHAERVGRPAAHATQESAPQTPTKVLPKESAIELLAALSRKDRKVGELVAMVKEAERKLVQREDQCKNMERLVDA